MRWNHRIMRQISTQQSLANLQFVDAFVRGSDELLADVVSGGSGLESVQTQPEIVGLAPVT